MPAGLPVSQSAKRILNELKELQSEDIVFTAAPSAGERAANPYQLREQFGRGGVIIDAFEALDQARLSASQQGIVLICESLYLVGDLRPVVTA